ncbi:MAG: PA14 domain-containing protein [Phycisphaerae bacterium]
MGENKRRSDWRNAMGRLVLVLAVTTAFGLAERAMACGGEGQRACCIHEQIPSCDPGLVEAGSCSGNCGLFDCSIGNCVDPQCGGEGQRACCAIEQVALGQGPCDAGLYEDLTTAGDCQDVLGSENCDCVANGDAFQSLGICVSPRTVGQQCSLIGAPPCASGLTCFPTGLDEAICMPDDGDSIFENEVCGALYSQELHQNAIDEGMTKTYGTGASAAAGINTSVEVGVVYGRDGSYGCYIQNCEGGETDLNVNVFAAFGDLLEDFDKVAGTECVITGGASFPFAEVGGIVGSTSFSGCPYCGPIPLGCDAVTGSSTAISLGIGLVPVTAGAAECTTETSLYGCLINGTFFIGCDSDSDGVPNPTDLCEGFDDNVDPDGDGVPMGCDVCAAGDDNLDTDGDGIADACDACPNGSNVVDSDGDNVVDGCDECPSDPNKTQLGICGCFVPDVDSDNDGFADCVDLCPGERDDLDQNFNGIRDCLESLDNDACVDAIPLPAGADIDGFVINADTTNGVSCGQNWTDIWYSYTNTSPCYRDLTVSNCPLATVTRLLAIYDDCPEAGGVELQCGGDYPCSTRTQRVEAGQTVYIRIGNDLAAAGDVSFDLTLTVDGPDDSGPDSDGDGVPNTCDACEGVNDITAPDPDDDGIPSACDNCPNDFNPDQGNVDGDSLGDACEPQADFCEEAIQIGEGVVFIDNTNATQSGQGSPFPSANDEPMNYDNWYQFTAPANGVLDYDICFATDFFVDVLVYRGECSDLGDFYFFDQRCTLGCGTIPCQFLGGSGRVEMLAGETVRLQVGSRVSVGGNPPQGTGSLTIDFIEGACAIDDDGDGICTRYDNCPLVPNPDQADNDADTFGDACDNCFPDDNRVDCDGNGVTDCDETTLTGLIGTYFNTDNYTGPTISRVDPVIDVVYGDGPPLPDYGVNQFSIRWTGYLLTEQTGLYEFQTFTTFEDTQDLRVNDQFVCGGNGGFRTGTIELEGGRIYPISFQFTERFGGFAEAHVSWIPPGGSLEIVPTTNLRPALNCDGNDLPDQCQPDSDADGVIDACDLCPGNDDSVDADGDTIPDACDACPGVDDLTAVDTDGDGTPDCGDECPNDPNKSTEGQCGCGFTDTDTDADGTADCNDLCPEFDALSIPGPCGCTLEDADSDKDGTPDCVDYCPSDFDKIEPGACGCGNSDVDSDNDTVADCIDLCAGFDDLADVDGDTIPDGCDLCVGVDASGDSDNDGACDNFDSCDADPNKVLPGVCGCGIPDSDVDGDAVVDCLAPASVTAVGPRYIEVEPVAADALMAIAVELNSQTCLTLGFVDLDDDPQLAALGVAKLVDTPVFRNGGDWGRLLVRDDEIIPGREYSVRPIFQGSIAQAEQRTTLTHQNGDVDNSGATNFGDIQFVVQAFQGTYGGSLGSVDLAPCTPNGIVNFEDIQYAVFAFQQQPYASLCSEPCAGGVASTGGQRADTLTVELRLVQDESEGDQVEVEVWALQAADLHTFQFALELVDQQGTAHMANVAYFATDHVGAVYTEVVTAANVARGELGAVSLDGGVDVSPDSPAYLGSFTFTLPQGDSRKYAIGFREGQHNLAHDSRGRAMAIDGIDDAIFIRTTDSAMPKGREHRRALSARAGR